MGQGFDPFLYGAGVRRLVTRKGSGGIERLYKKAPSTDPENVRRAFRRSNYYGGTSVADALGCNLRCIFCWTRDRLRNNSQITRMGTFYSPFQVAQAIKDTAKQCHLHYARITEGEPTLDEEHLCSVLSCLRNSGADFTFILETNGLLLGKYPKLARKIAQFDKSLRRGSRFLHVRVSIKGPTPEKFQLLTFADKRFHDLQFAAVKNCLDAGLGVHPATMLDFIESKDEIQYLESRIEETGLSLPRDLEWERLFLENYVIGRLRKYGVSYKMVFEERARAWSKQL